MDSRAQIINSIELQYQSYLNRQSDTLFNSATNDLYDSITNISICQNIVSEIKRKHPIDNDLLNKNQGVEYFTYIDNITQSTDYYISYCIQWFEYIRFTKGIHSPEGYDQKCHWLCSNIRGSKDSMMLFKTDFIRPIINYLVRQLNSEVYLLHVLDRFKQRVERFKTINITSETNELSLQKDLFLYLFDQGLELGNSTNIGNGEVDFIIDVNGSPFIIEAKFHKKGKSHNGYLSQLKDYMNKVSAKFGCLYIFTTEDVSFEFETPSNNLFVRTIYVGDKKPSQRTTDIKTLTYR